MLNLNGGVLGVVDEDLERRVEALLLLFLLVSFILAPSCKKPKLVQAHALAPDLETRAPGADTTKVLCICNFVLPFSKITHFSPKNFKFHSICKLAH